MSRVEERPQCFKLLAMVRMILLLAVLLLAGFASTKPLFAINIEDLESHSLNMEEFKAALSIDGAFAVTGLSADYLGAVQELTKVAPKCFQTNQFPKNSLADGSIRTTYATNIENAYPDCILHAGSIINKEFDRVFHLVAESLEAAAGGAEHLSFKETEDGDSLRFSSLQFKDHVHVYESMDSRVNPGLSLSFHTDSGILLMLTPSVQLPVQIQSIHKEHVDTSVTEANSIILIVARGLPDWLLRGTSAASGFFPAPHAVPSLSGKVEARTVFARMMVAPLDAIPADDLAYKSKFQDIFLQRSIENPEELCPLDLTTEDFIHDESPVCGDNPELAECWMGCLSVPDCNGEEKLVCTNRAGETCCNEYDSPDGCLDMDTSCEWKCDARMINLF